MKLRGYIWGMRLITALAFFILVSVVFYVDPETSGRWEKFSFYATLFFFLTGFFNLFLLLVRRKTIGEDMPLGNVGLSFRQAFLLASLFVGLLILQSFRALFWWSGLLVLGGIFLVELYFLTRK